MFAKVFSSKGCLKLPHPAAPNPYSGPGVAVAGLLLVGMAARAGKPVNRLIRLIVGAGQAKPAPPVGPALGAHKVNLMAFCKDFNARTAKMKPDVPMAVSLTAYKVRRAEAAQLMTASCLSGLIGRLHQDLKKAGRGDHMSCGVLRAQHGLLVRFRPCILGLLAHQWNCQTKKGWEALYKS